MTTNRKRIYEIIIISLVIMFTSLCAYMGITAIQKSMKLNMSFQINPSFECRIDYNGDTIFCNTTKNDESLVVGNGVSLSGNNLTLNQTFYGLGAEFTLTIHNYTKSKIMISVSGTGANGNILILDSYTSGAALYDNITITATGASATLTFVEYVGYTLTYNSNSGTGSMSASEYPSGVSNALKPNTFTMPQTENHSVGTFAGWNTKADGSGITYSDKEIILITQNTTLYAMWDYVWIIKQYDGTNTAAWGGYYCVEFGEYPQSIRENNVTILDENGNNITSTTAIGTIGYSSDGARYCYQADVYGYGTSEWYKFEPIRWIIIGAGANCSSKYMPSGALTTAYAGGNGTNTEIGANQLLLLSEFGLYASKFNDYDLNKFGGSIVEISLNTDFADMAGLTKYFADIVGENGAGEYIAKVQPGTTYSINGGKNGAYPEFDDASSYNMCLIGGVGASDTYYYEHYLSSSQLNCSPTLFARATGVYGFYGGNPDYTQWWFRSGSTKSYICTWGVQSTGVGNECSLHNSTFAVRPCFVMNLA